MLRAFLIFATVAILLCGCKTPPQPVASNAYWTRPDWQRVVLQDLAFDIREDGRVDYEWPEAVPVATRRQLEGKARVIVDKGWTGE